MNEKIPKWEDLTETQQADIVKISRKYILKSMFTTMNYGGLMIFSNLTLILANQVYLHSLFLLFLISVTINVTLMRLMSNALRETNVVIQAEVQKALKNK